MKQKKVVCLSMISFLALSAHNSFALTATEIILKSDELVRGKTQKAEFEIIIKSRRFERTLVLISYENRKERKSFSVIKSPEKDAGNRFLLVEDNMWHYQPKIQKVIKISPSMMLDSWMGSDFSNDDIVKESSIVNDYTHEITGTETVDGHVCHRIELKPKPNAAVVWGKIIYYARQSDCLPVKEEFYNERGVLKKQMVCSDFKKMHDRVIPTVYKMTTVGKDDQYTMMTIKSAVFDMAISENVFTLQYLKKG